MAQEFAGEGGAQVPLRMWTNHPAMAYWLLVAQTDYRRLWAIEVGGNLVGGNLAMACEMPDEQASHHSLCAIQAFVELAMAYDKLAG